MLSCKIAIDSINNGQAIILVDNVFYFSFNVFSQHTPCKNCSHYVNEFKMASVQTKSKIGGQTKNRYLLIFLGEINILSNSFCCLFVDVHT